MHQNHLIFLLLHTKNNQVNIYLSAYKKRIPESLDVISPLLISFRMKLFFQKPCNALEKQPTSVQNISFTRQQPFLPFMKFSLSFLLLFLSFNGLSQVWQTADGPNTDPLCVSVYELGGYILTNTKCATFVSSDQGALYEPIRGGNSTGTYTTYNNRVYFYDYSKLQVIQAANGNWNFSEQSHGQIRDLYATDQGMYLANDRGAKSSVNGVNWIDINNGLPTDWYYWPTGPTSADSAMYHVLNGICANNNSLFAATDSGVYKSPISTINWQAINTGLPVTTFEHIRCKGDTIFASSQQDVYRSTDGGMSWSLSWTLNSGGINRIRTANDSVFLLTNEEGLIFSGDYGINWNSANIGLGALDVWDINYIDNFYFLASAQGISKGFNNWVSADYGAVCSYTPAMIESQNGIMAMSGQEAFYLGDDSTSWVNTTENISIWKMTSITMVNDKLIISLDPDQIYDSLIRNYESPDNGLTWTPTSQLGPYGPYELRSNGTMLSARYGDTVHVSSDGGYNWSEITSLPPSGAFCTGNSPVLFGENNWFVFGCDGSGRISRSSDNGQTWEDTGLGQSWGGRVERLWEFGDTLFASTSLGLFYSTNQGDQWDVCGSGIPGIGSPNSTTVKGMISWHGNFYASSSKYVYVSFNGGLTFEIISTGLPDVWGSGPETGSNLVVRNDTLYFGTPRYGTYFVDLLALEPFLEVHAQKREHKIESYPNPSDGIVTIGIGELASSADLELFSLSGKRVYATHLKYFKEKQFDLTHLKGVYILKITTDEFTENKRLVLN
jgi:hypothetical protein